MSEEVPEEVLVLPRVASNFYYACKKCASETFHVVLAHPTNVSAKLECEICGSKKTYKLPSSKSRARSKKTSVRSSAANAWAMFNDKIGTDAIIPYKMSNTFEIQTAIDHVKFGVGYIKSSNNKKIEVVFEDAIRLLVHNR